MIRLGLLAVLGLATLGCSTSRKVVVQNGYPGVQPPAGFEARPSGNISFAPDSRAEVGASTPQVPTNP